MANKELKKHETNLPARTLDLGKWSQSETTTAIADVLAHFLLTLKSPHTRRNYHRDILEFIDFSFELGAPVRDVRDVTEKMVLLWEAALQQKHSRYQGSRRRVVQTSLARKLSSLSSMLSFAHKRKLIDANCMDTITRPRIKRESKTNAFTADEVKRILAFAAEATNTLTDGKDERTRRSVALRYAVLYTLFSVGMRVDELCELRIGDLEVTADFARLHMTAKGGQSHAPIIHGRTVEVLQNYINTFRPGARNDDLLFVRAQKVKNETKLTQQAVYEMITSLAKEAGIDKKVSPHSCRATLATLLHGRGVPIGQIQELLNHKQITTTAIYIKKANELSEAAATKIDILE